MDMKQCSAGHFYDASKYASCPYCGEAPRANAVPFTGSPNAGIGETVPIYQPDPVYDPAGQETIAIIEEFDPIVGWLVCVEGPDKGADFGIHNQVNYIGRDSSMDINIANDPTVSRERQISLVYDQRSRKFYVGMTGGASIVRLNSVPLIATTEIKLGDKLEVGRTVLMFVPLCGEAFDWDWEKK